VVHYGRTEYSYSDHRPISAIYDLNIRLVDEQKRNQLHKEISRPAAVAQQPPVTEPVAAPSVEVEVPPDSPPKPIETDLLGLGI
jgi:hypothetical protein